jgi:3-isopropylmalate dehydrogenase
MILSSAMLIDHLGVKHSKPEYCKAASAIDAAVDAALRNSHVRTPDLAGSGGTRVFAQAVREAIKV